jgi:tetratricopeptide (TPR) repeat protein
MISLAAIYMDRGEHHLAEAELYQVLEAEPGHVTASEMLDQLGGVATGVADGAAFSPYSDDHFDTTTAQVTDPGLMREAYDPDAPLPSYDFEEISADRAMAPRDPVRPVLDSVDDPFGGAGAPLPSFPLRPEEDIDDYLDEPVIEDFEPAVDPSSPSFPAAGALPSIPAEAIEDVLDEAEFFMSRGLSDDARGILVDALARSPNHPLLTERLREIDGGQPGDSGARECSELDAGEPQDDRIFDIAASLDALDELEQVTRSSRPPSSLRAVDEVDVDQVFAKFKEGVRAQVSDSDSATHYDLGVAYKEMGLHPDAINEFGIAGRDPKLECTCFAMIGMIHLEQGDLDKAAEAYIRGLGASQKNVDQEMSLYYDLGTVYEMKGSDSEALYYFQKIARRDPGYRDVRERIEALEPPSVAGRTAAGARQIQSDEELEAAFDDLFESK